MQGYFTRLNMWSKLESKEKENKMHNNKETNGDAHMLPAYIITLESYLNLDVAEFISLINYVHLQDVHWLNFYFYYSIIISNIWSSHICE